MNIMSVRNTYSPKLRILAYVGDRSVAWRVVVVLRSGHSLIPLLRSGHPLIPLWRCMCSLCSSVSIPVGEDVCRHNPVSAPSNRIKQSRCRQGDNITSVNAINQVIRNGNVRTIMCKKVMVIHGCMI